ncbi:uncharacterized protein EAF02_011228 [Botrytis sinoallii]|uniref:uncharacterized protein n=1 Tax=Botrytis sinoallii TaxID=1463999 RepID=UPI0018FF495C|nr:uncharacterized protein EAF02_011228 [Botrytis sinoallii]KAF7857861.1 hypothetical protein EAF02_011228 [Botrytis sinoallii]
MASQTSITAVQGSITFDVNLPSSSTSTTQTSPAEQSSLSSNRTQTYTNNPQHSTTYASPTLAYNGDQAAATQYYTAAARNSIQNFDAAFNGNGGGQ